MNARIICRWILLLATAAIGLHCRSDSSDSFDAAIADGSYSVSGPTCFSNGEPPEYPSADAKSALLDFDSIQTHLMGFSGRDVTETIADADCTLTIVKKIFTNHSGYFSTTQERTFTWAPSTCEFAVTVGGQSLVAAAGRSAAFADSALKTEDVPWRADAIADGLALTSLGQEPVSSLWSKYGCTVPDALVYRLSRR